VSAIVDFLEGRGVDGRGRTLDQVLAFDDAALERHHDFIQWLFPLSEPSGAVAGSPVLSPGDVAAIRTSTVSANGLQRAAARMAAFYRGNDHWLVRFDHNHLRITRILKSLRLLLGDAPADAFRRGVLDRVEAAGGPVDATAVRHWLRA